MNIKVQFSLEGRTSQDTTDGNELEMSVSITDTGVSVQAIGKDGCPDSDVYLELMDGLLDIHVWDRQTVDGNDPIFSGSLLEIEHGKSNEAGQDHDRAD